ncbi:MAG: DNA recombination protein RmuC [Propionibacteriaceae bacterium]|nr:DNA recombination protein RmuC [Propionibacteriaceae bacterium]
MNAWIIVALIAGLAAGVVIGWLIGRSGASVTASTQTAEAERARAEAATARGDAASLRAEIASSQADTAEMRQVVAEYRAEAEAAKARLAQSQANVAAALAQREAALQRVADGVNDRAALVAQFKALSAETLAEQGKRADATADDRLRRTEALMAPVNENLSALRERLTQVEKERSAIAAEMRQQVTTVVATSENLRRETNILTTALRKPQVRGSWGETQLRRVVEIAGMVEHVDFAQQQTTTTSDDKTIRPDLKVMLGEGKFCYVDSKVPLTAFLDAQEAHSEDERAAALRRFAVNVRAHIDQLSNKMYWKADLGSPEFVALFIPSDALYAEALTQAPDLMEYAGARNIILTTPTSLIGLLRAVAYGWKQTQLADTAAEVAELGRELYDRLARLGSVVDQLGRSLTGSVKSYNQMVGSLESRVLVTARRMGDLQASTKALEPPATLDDAVRTISAPELVEDAAQMPALLGRMQAV